MFFSWFMIWLFIYSGAVMFFKTLALFAGHCRWQVSLLFTVIFYRTYHNKMSNSNIYNNNLWRRPEAFFFLHIIWCSENTPSSFRHLLSIMITLWRATTCLPTTVDLADSHLLVLIIEYCIMYRSAYTYSHTIPKPRDLIYAYTKEDITRGLKYNNNY